MEVGETPDERWTVHEQDPMPSTLEPLAEPEMTRYPPDPHQALRHPLRVLTPASLWASTVAAWRANRRGLLVGLIGTAALKLITEWVALVNQYGVNFPRQVIKHPMLLVQVWSHWNAEYYVSIAQYGYAGNTVGRGQAVDGIAFAPLYPWSIRLLHAATHIDWLACAEILTAIATVLSVAILYRIVNSLAGPETAGSTVLMLLAFPTAFFLLAPYPDAQGLLLVMLAFVCARRHQWILSGVFAAAATLDKYYLCIIVLALAFEVWEQRQLRLDGLRRNAAWAHELVSFFALVMPTLAALGLWMGYQQVHNGNQFAFIHAQTLLWHRHIATPWTLFTNVGHDIVHWRFTNAAPSGAIEVVDLVTVVLLAVATVHVFTQVRRSYGVLLGLSWCVYTFQTFLLGVTQEVLVLFPLFISLGIWASGRRWRERALLILFLPCSYFLIARFATDFFAG
jgi:hypothetical protein